jgi:hypothetical protein
MDAYGEIVRRFQDMAVGYAHALLGDFHLAEDAAQEAFLRAYLDLGKLHESAAFPGWFRRIVFKHCDRVRRKKTLHAVPLDGAGELASGEHSRSGAAFPGRIARLNLIARVLLDHLIGAWEDVLDMQMLQCVLDTNPVAMIANPKNKCLEPEGPVFHVLFEVKWEDHMACLDVAYPSASLAAALEQLKRA